MEMGCGVRPFTSLAMERGSVSVIRQMSGNAQGEQNDDSEEPDHTRQYDEFKRCFHEDVPSEDHRDEQKDGEEETEHAPDEGKQFDPVVEVSLEPVEQSLDA
jgi:hypothetical protein